MRPVLTYRPFEPGDLAAIALGPGHSHVAGRDNRAMLGAQLAVLGRCWTAMAGTTGTILMCGGVVQPHDGHAQLWSFMAPESRLYMTPLTRAVRGFVAKLPQRRVDAHVRADFAPGHRWMTMLGFAREAELANYFPDGEAAVVYRKVP